MYNNVQLSKKYDIKRMTVIEILKANEKILEAAEEGCGSNRKRLKKAVNQGIIENLKNHYKKLLLHERIENKSK
uniref:DNA binding HTH domain-containing protein n=1 Tax=Acrobeloides nanus TaxID=290746 RepID=A0A914CK53_9BILA